MLTKALQRRSWRLAVCLLTALTCAATAARSALAGPLSTEQVLEEWGRRAGHHPLTGKLLMTADGQLLDGVALARGPMFGRPVATAFSLSDARIVLLGEVHDNADHHLLRAGLVDDATRPGPFGREAQPGVVAEHIDDSRIPAVGLSQSGADATDQSVELLFSRLDWDRSGWPAAAMFRPLFRAVIDARLTLYPGNLPREEIRGLVRGGIETVLPARREMLGLDRRLPEPLQETLAAELKGSHCGMLPDSAVPGMALAQHARDGRMASALLQAAANHGRAILLAGNGHVRSDRGVPWHIRAIAPEAKVLSIMLVEVDDARTDPGAYVPRDPAGRPAADIVIFTPRTPREDPCERMRAHIKGKG